MSAGGFNFMQVEVQISAKKIGLRRQVDMLRSLFKLTLKDTQKIDVFISHAARRRHN